MADSNHAHAELLARICGAYAKEDVHSVLLALNASTRHRFTCLLQATEATMRLLALVDKAGRRTTQDFLAIRAAHGFILRTALTPDMSGPDPGPSRWTGDLPIEWNATARIMKKGIEPVGILFHFDSYRQPLDLAEQGLLRQAAGLFPSAMWSALAAGDGQTAKSADTS